MPPSEIQIVIGRVRAGDVDAYRVIVRAYQPDVFRVVSYAALDHHTAQDLVQDVFVRAYRALDRFDADRDIGAWLRGIARNLVREELRRRGSQRKRHASYQMHYEVTRAEETADAHEESLKAALHDCRGALPDDANRAIQLRYERGLSFDEVAAALGRSVAGARQLLQRVRLKLRDCIETKVEAI